VTHQAGGTEGGIVVGTAVGARQRSEYGGEHAQAQRQERGIGGAVVQSKRFIEEGQVRDRQFRAIGLNRASHETPRDRLGPAEEGKDEEADGKGTAGGALGKERERKQRRCDALQRPPVLQRTRHVRASFARAYSGAGAWQGDKIAAGTE